MLIILIEKVRIEEPVQCFQQMESGFPHMPGFSFLKLSVSRAWTARLRPPLTPGTSASGDFDQGDLFSGFSGNDTRLSHRTTVSNPSTVGSVQGDVPEDLE